MTYLRRTNPAAKRGKRTTSFIVLCVLGLFLVHFFFPRFYPALLYPVTSLFWKSESNAIGGFVYLAKIVQSKYSLVKENKRLSDEISSRDSSMLLLDSLRKENESLKSTLGRTAKGNDLLGVILSRPPISPYDTIIIDVGSNDGVTVGDKVYTDGDTLVGDIAETYANQSKVSLYSTPGRVIPIIIGSTNAEVQAVGRGGGNFTAKLPVELEVKKGDTIIMPQIRPHIFGVVEDILVDSSDSLQTVLFKTPINIHEFRFIQVDRSSVI